MPWAIGPCMSQPPKCSVTKPTPASHSRRASSICCARPVAVQVARAAAISRLTSKTSRARLEHQVERLRLEAVQPLHQAAAVDFAVERVEGLQQRRRSARRSSVTCRFMLLRALPPVSNGA